MAAPKLRDLDSYVRKNGQACGTCASEHRAFIEQAKDAGYNISAVVRYLNEQFDTGLLATAVRRHFRERHHEQKAKAKRS